MKHRPTPARGVVIAALALIAMLAACTQTNGGATTQPGSAAPAAAPGASVGPVPSSADGSKGNY